MISKKEKDQINEILKRISSGKEVTLQERVYLQQFADKDQTISSWLNKATNNQQLNPLDPIENLLNDLGLFSPDPQSYYKPDEDDIGEWFSGAPSWITRS